MKLKTITAASLGAAIRTARERRGLSMHDLSSEAGVAYNTLQRLETGLLDDVKVSTIVSILGVLGYAIRIVKER